MMLDFSIEVYIRYTKNVKYAWLKLYVRKFCGLSKTYAIYET